MHHQKQLDNHALIDNNLYLNDKWKSWTCDDYNDPIMGYILYWCWWSDPPVVHVNVVLDEREERRRNEKNYAQYWPA